MSYYKPQNDSNSSLPGRVTDMNGKCLALQDPMGWSEVGNFDLSETISPPKPQVHDAVYPAQDDSTEDVGYHTPAPELCRPGVGMSQGKSVSHSTHTESKFSSPPMSLQRKKTRERADQSLSDDANCSSFADTTKSSLKSTPVKGLPFSPSQVRSVNRSVTTVV